VGRLGDLQNDVVVLDQSRNDVDATCGLGADGNLSQDVEVSTDPRLTHCTGGQVRRRTWAGEELDGGDEPPLQCLRALLQGEIHESVGPEYIDDRPHRLQPFGETAFIP